MLRPATRAVVSYNLGRFGLLVACLVLAALAGLRGVLLFVVALVVSGVLSWFLLGRQRVAMGAAVAGALSRNRAKLAARTQAEDAYVDEMLARSDVTPTDR
jgi:hypothetical protein